MNSVLLIDDDEDYTFLMDIFFQKLSLIDDYRIENDVLSAIAYLEHCSKESFPSVIFVDINMPLSDGFSFLSAFDEKFPDLSDGTRIYMLTSSVRSADYEKAKSYHHVKDVLVKPITTENLEKIFS